MDPILLAIREYADALEQTDWSTHGDDGRQYAQILAEHIRGYVDSNLDIDLTPVDQTATLERITTMQNALSRRNLFDAYDDAQAMIGSLPMPPVSLPTPPWKR